MKEKEVSSNRWFAIFMRVIHELPQIVSHFSAYHAFVTNIPITLDSKDIVLKLSVNFNG